MNDGDDGHGVGEAEQIRTEYGKENIHLKSRKGFVRLAMEEGAHLVPIYVFGETSLYKVSPNLLKSNN